MSYRQTHHQPPRQRLNSRSFRRQNVSEWCMAVNSSLWSACGLCLEATGPPQQGFTYEVNQQDLKAFKAFTWQLYRVALSHGRILIHASVMQLGSSGTEKWWHRLCWCRITEEIDRWPSWLFTVKAPSIAQLHYVTFSGVVGCWNSPLRCTFHTSLSLYNNIQLPHRYVSKFSRKLLYCKFWPHSWSDCDMFYPLAFFFSLSFQ